MSSAIAIGVLLKSKVEALGLAGITTVDVRKLPVLPQGKSPPAVIISVGEDDKERLFSNVFMVKYPTALTIVTQGLTWVEDTALRTWRFQLEELMYDDATFVTLTGFNKTEWRAGPPYNRAGLDVNFNYSPVTFTIEVEETRA